MIEVNEDISLKARNKLPQEIKDERNKELFKNLILACLVTFYFGIINFIYFNFSKAGFTINMRFFSIPFIILAIYFFEKGYKNDSEGTFLYGVEAFFIGFFTLIMPFTLYVANRTLNGLFSICFMYFAIYYIIKGLIISRKIEKKYVPSDAREIAKKDKIK